MKRWGKPISEARNKLLAIPSKIQGRFGDVDPTLIEDLDALIHETLTDLADRNYDESDLGNAA